MLQDCMIAFVFADQSEADTLYNKVTNRSKNCTSFLHIPIPYSPERILTLNNTPPCDIVYRTICIYSTPVFSQEIRQASKIQSFVFWRKQN